MKNIIIGAALLVTLTLGVLLPQPSAVQVVRDTFGSGSSEATDNVREFGGVRSYSYSAPMSQTASNTPIAGAQGFRLPNATTTMDLTECLITTATGTAATIGLYLGATPGATSTATLIEVSLAANTKTAIVTASSTINAPNLYVTFGAKGAPSGFIYGGKCNIRYSEVL